MNAIKIIDNIFGSLEHSNNQHLSVSDYDVSPTDCKFVNLVRIEMKLDFIMFVFVFYFCQFSDMSAFLVVGGHEKSFCKNSFIITDFFMFLKS